MKSGAVPERGDAARRAETGAGPADRKTVILAVLAAASIALAVLILARRNIYDDELQSFGFIRMTMARIWSAAGADPVHPPGMYVLGRLFFRLIPSARWMTLGPLAIFYLGSIWFLFRARSYFGRDTAAFAVFALAGLFHPHLLMWSNSIRWYPSWTGLALIALTAVLRLGRRDETGPPDRSTLSWGEVALFVVLGAALVYLNYLSFFLFAALAAGWAVRFRLRPPLAKAAVLVIGTAVLCLPQILIFVRLQAPNAGNQAAPLFVSFARLAHGVLIGEALLPWHPAAVMMLVCEAALAVGFLLLRRRPPSVSAEGPDGPRLVPPILAVVLLLGLLGGLSGLGGKPRSFLILAPLAGFLAAAALKRIGSRAATAAALAVLAVWIGFGARNLLAREGTAKSGWNDKPEDVVHFVVREAGGGCVLIFAVDPGLAYALNEARAGRRWSVCSLFPDHVHGVARGEIRDRDCRPDIVFIIDSGRTASDEIRAVMSEAAALLDRPRRRHFVPDPDVARKQAIPGLGDFTRGLPFFRHEVVFGRPKDGADWAAVARLFVR